MMSGSIGGWIGKTGNLPLQSEEQTIRFTKRISVIIAERIHRLKLTNSILV